MFFKGTKVIITMAYYNVTFYLYQEKRMVWSQEYNKHAYQYSKHPF